MLPVELALEFELESVHQEVVAMNSRVRAHLNPILNALISLRQLDNVRHKNFSFSFIFI